MIYQSMQEIARLARSQSSSPAIYELAAELTDPHRAKRALAVETAPVDVAAGGGKS